MLGRLPHEQVEDHRQGRQGRPAARPALISEMSIVLDGESRDFAQAPGLRSRADRESNPVALLRS